MLYVTLIAALAVAAPLTAADLAPVLPGPAAGAGEALSERRWEDALKLLDGVAGPEARLLRARALSHLDRHEQAVAALDGLDIALSEIADRVLFLRGRELAALERPLLAAEAWGGVPPTSVLWDAAMVERGRALAAAGKVDEAIRILGPIGERAAPADLSEEDHAATALAALGALAAPKDPGAARKAFLACWVEHSVAPEANGCGEALLKLPGAAGAAPTVEQELARAERLLEANRNKTAIAALERLLPRVGPPAPEPAPACRARLALGRAYRKERMHSKAVELLRPIVAKCAEPNLRARAAFVLAGSLSIVGDKDGALAQYRSLAKEHPASVLADDALLSAGDLLERLGRPGEALELFGAAAGRGPEADKRPEALFRGAWGQRRAGALDASVAALRAIEEEFRDKDPYEHARAAYWRARILSGRGEEGIASAKPIWEELVRRYPVDWYGLLSRARLAQLRGDEIDALPSPAGDPKTQPLGFEPGALRASPRLIAALRLLRMGLGEDAAEELRAIDLAPFRGSPAGVEPIFAVAALLDRAGDHRSAHQILKTDGRAVLRAAPAGEALRLWRIAYPPAFRAEVERWSRPVGVAPDLLQALMREESALDPRVISPAGAIGLTQLMPATAAQVAQRLKLKANIPQSLVDPETNIRIGAAYLGELLTKFGRQPALALAAYNAGDGAVRRWLDQRGGLELDEFVEEIPIDETRGYVKRVLRTYASYRLLTAGGEGSLGGEPLDLLPRMLRRGAHSEAISPGGDGPVVGFWTVAQK